MISNRAGPSVYKRPDKDATPATAGLNTNMGLKIEYIRFIDDCIVTELGGMAGTNMLELGNQHIDEKRGRVAESTGKEYYTNRGCNHISVDLNAEDGALPLDLSRPIDKPEWQGFFDIVTNSGTTEHVEPFDSQYECFENIHNWMKVGGIAVHLVPDDHELVLRGRWKNHCNNYYSLAFFEALAEANNYRIATSALINQLICVCLVKEQEQPFMADREALLQHITRKSGGTLYFGINDAGFSRTQLFIARLRAFRKKLFRRR